NFDVLATLGKRHQLVNNWCLFPRVASTSKLFRSRRCYFIFTFFHISKYMSDFYQRTCQKCGGIRDPNVFSTVMSFGDNYVAITYGKRKGERAPKGCDD